MGMAVAAELLPADREVATVVDHYVEQRLSEAGVVPASQADDANLFRRLMLDLAGRIPTTREVREYLASNAPDKRVRLVDQILASREFLAHQINEFDTLLMFGTSGNLRQYLTQAIEERRGWDRVFRDLIIGRDEAAGAKGTDQFLKARVKDSDRLTNDVSMLFFGVNISCVQCHDHPLVDEWKQDHFYGLKSFFNRTFDNGGFLAERDYGMVTYKTSKGEDRTAHLMFLSGTMLEEPAAHDPSNEEKKRESQQMKEWAEKKIAPPTPKFSRRTRLIDVALRPSEGQFFARSIVNRVWYRFMGYGLVMPIDQLQAENTASHPELLDWLARDLAAHGYDLTRLIRGLVLSQTYSCSSRWEHGDRPEESLFAVAEVRALSPSQLAASLRIATADPVQFDSPQKPADVARRIDGLVGSSRGLASLFDMPQSNFQVSTTEPLLFSNGDVVAKELLADGNDRLVGRLKRLANIDQKIEAAMWAVLSRPPTPEELRVLGEYARGRSDRPTDAIAQIVWAVRWREFRFNY